MGQPNEIYDKYLTRAISEINELTGEVLRCRKCPHTRTMPVIGSGHPLADIMLLKYKARPSECHEGVAFFGRAGTAVMKSCQRLGIDPLQLYGTNVIKCGTVSDDPKAEKNCREYLRRELAIVEPKIIVAMGEQVVAALNALELPTVDAARVRPRRDRRVHARHRGADDRRHRRLARRTASQGGLLARLPASR